MKSGGWPDRATRELRIWVADSVFFRDSRIDVDAGEQGEDVCLQDHDQHFEEEDEHSSGEGQDGEELESVRGVEEEEARRGEAQDRSEEHTSELQSRGHLVCRLLLEKKKK